MTEQKLLKYLHNRFVPIAKEHGLLYDYAI